MRVEQYEDRWGWLYVLKRRASDGEVVIHKKKKSAEFSPIIYINKEIARKIASFIERTDK